MQQEVKVPITYEQLKQDMIDSGRPYDFGMVDRAYALADAAPRSASRDGAAAPRRSPPLKCRTSHNFLNKTKGTRVYTAR